MRDKFFRGLIAFFLLLLLAPAAGSQEVFIGNPGRSLNFLRFDLVIERGFFKELGLDVKLLNAKCDIAVTALLKDMKRIVAGSTATRLQGLKAGSLDATTLSPPFNVYAEQMGLRVLAYVGDFLEFPQSGFTVSDATLKNKRELIKKLLRGTLRGLQFTLMNRADTVRFIAKDYKLQDAAADKVYASLLPAMSENGLATDKGLKVMVETLGTAVGKNVDFPPERLVDYTLLKEVQKELSVH